MPLLRIASREKFSKFGKLTSWRFCWRRARQLAEDLKKKKMKKRIIRKLNFENCKKIKSYLKHHGKPTRFTGWGGDMPC
jgi:hypothetical protein